MTPPSPLVTQALLKPEYLPIILAISVWTIAWKGLALWRAARRGEKPWFVALLIVNMLGILEIFYIYVFNKKPRPVTPAPPKA